MKNKLDRFAIGNSKTRKNQNSRNHISGLSCNNSGTFDFSRSNN